MELKKRLVGTSGSDYYRTFSTEDGVHYRGSHQELGPAMRRSKLMREAQEHRGRGQYDRDYVGSIPKAVLHDWLKKHGYSNDEWARNEGGDPYIKFAGGPGVYDQFLTFFLSRDFSKLHTQHTTTRRETNQFVVPDSIKLKAKDLTGIKDGHLRKPEGIDSKLD